MSIPPGFSAAELRALVRAKLAPELSPEAFARTSEPRVSGVHATLKLDAGQLVVRDESSNNGTWVSGARLSPGVWTPVPAGTLADTAYQGD